MTTLGGHLRTVMPRLRQAIAPLPAPPSQPWSLVVDDPRLGPVRLSGELSDPGDWGTADPAATSGVGDGPAAAGGRPLVLLVHGLGGCSESHYLRRVAGAAVAAGWACLRLNLRGSDRRGEDFYHAGLSADLHAALASPELAGYAPLYALGFSLGGHLVLRMATEPTDPRLAAVAVVAAPLALAPCAEAFDRPRRALYRAYLLASLKAIYDAVAARRPVPLPAEQARRIRYIQEWDERVVAPRHGFAGAADYYRRASVASRLASLHLPALLVAAEDDPMVPAAALAPALADPPPSLEVRWLAAAGHLGFGPDLDAVLLAWLAGHG